MSVLSSLMKFQGLAVWPGQTNPIRLTDSQDEQVIDKIDATLANDKFSQEFNHPYGDIINNTKNPPCYFRIRFLSEAPEGNEGIQISVGPFLDRSVILLLTMANVIGEDQKAKLKVLLESVKAKFFPGLKEGEAPHSKAGYCTKFNNTEVRVVDDTMLTTELNKVLNFQI